MEREKRAVRTDQAGIDGGGGVPGGARVHVEAGRVLRGD